MQVWRLSGSDDYAPTLSSKHLRAQQIRIFIVGNKPEHPIGDEEHKFMRNVNGGIISVPDGKVFFFFDLRILYQY